MSRPNSANARPASEELNDPWAAIDAPKPAAAVAPLSTSGAAAEVPGLGPDDPAITGKIPYSCAIPAAAGGVLGLAGGAVLNVFGKQSATIGALAGASTMITVSSVTCLLVKSRDGSIYDPSWDRTAAYAAGGFVWPISSEIFRTMFRHPILHPKVALTKSVVCAALGGVFGGTLDYFNIARPTREEAEKIKDKLVK